jgi:hypothetical protein
VLHSNFLYYLLNFIRIHIMVWRFLAFRFNRYLIEKIIIMIVWMWYILSFWGRLLSWYELSSRIKFTNINRWGLTVTNTRHTSICQRTILTTKLFSTDLISSCFIMHFFQFYALSLLKILRRRWLNLRMLNLGSAT